jgi:hypothetical protein
MGIPRSVAAILVVVAVIAIAKNVTVYIPNGATQAGAKATSNRITCSIMSTCAWNARNGNSIFTELGDSL